MRKSNSSGGKKFGKSGRAPLPQGERRGHRSPSARPARGREQDKSKGFSVRSGGDRSSYGSFREQGEEKAESSRIEGRNAVLEALRAGVPVDKVYLQDGSHDGPLDNIRKASKERDVQVRYVDREELDRMSETGHHQGAIAQVAAYEYASVEDILDNAKSRGESPFIILLDGVEDPHNLGAIIRTANLSGAHGVIIPKNRAVGLTPTVARTSAGALNYTPVAKVTNIAKTIEDLKKKGLWFVCGDMDGKSMYDIDFTGPMGLVMGGEGTGVGQNIRSKCDFVASIPMKGDINSLNTSVAAAVLMYEAVRQRMGKM